MRGDILTLCKWFMGNGLFFGGADFIIKLACIQSSPSRWGGMEEIGEMWEIWDWQADEVPPECRSIPAGCDPRAAPILPPLPLS